MSRRTHRTRKILYRLTLVLMSVILCGSIAFAYLQWKSMVANTFASETTEELTINESMENGRKTNVSVSVGDTGYSVYVRAAVLVNWIKDDSSKAIRGDAPQDTDYSIEYNLSANGWFLGDDGFYYYAVPVNGRETTDVLIKECRPLVDAPEGYKFNVDIVAQTIQAAGSTDADDVPAVTDAWGVSVDSNGNLAK